MGTTASSCIQANMYQVSFLLFATCLSNVFCQTARPPYPPGGPPPPPAQYPTPAPVQDYNPDIGQTNVGGYGVNKDPYCHKVEKVIFKNKCEPYKEKTCWTQNEEICSPAMYKNCTGVIETNIERVCFNVNELVCNLVEAVHYETLERRTRFRDASHGRTECATPPTTLTPPPRMTTSAATWRRPTATWKRRPSMMSPARIPWSSTARGRRPPRTMATDRKRSCALGLPSRIVTTFLERSKWRCARPMSTGTARSSPISSPSQLRSRTVTSSPRRSARWR